ncbi:two-partner secretion domain-containing protein [Nostoc sp.]|uniref:two-partner secretion domain-containing protein n=1 Tax=Nostoc sp. TaxID=1180 RepID=UPI002FF6E751
MKAKLRGYQSWESLLFGSGAITITGCCAFLMTSPIYAQIIPDNRLEVNSSVAPGCTACKIEGGTVRGSNLFHSFSEFSVPTGGEAYFNNTTQIQNIFTRVTGNSASNIDGLIRANGTANLFLINPNGIIFNSNASLNIGGSFIATTANSLNFSDGIKFSAVNSQTPPLLTINVPIGLQFGTNPGNIQLQGSNLKVNPRHTLALVGGNVQLNGGQLLASGGNVELGGMADTGTVSMSINGSYLGLSFPNGVERADVSLGNGTDVNVLGGGGSIAINAHSLDMTGENTQLQSGIPSGLGSVDSQAGDIEINATETINLNGSSISNTVQSTAVGNSGDINITTGSLYARNGGLLNTQTSGLGNAGSINIVARDTVSFDGATSFNRPSAASSALRRTAEGKGGNINITTRLLSVTNGGELVATNYGGKGDAGRVDIDARDTVVFDQGLGNIPTGAFSNVFPDGVGNGTSINITTGSLYLKNGAVLNVTTQGKGNAGNVNIFADDTVSLDGISANGTNVTTVVSGVQRGAEGQGGNIKITTGSLSVTNGGELVATNYGGKGDAGRVDIDAHDTVVFDKGLGNIATGAFSNVFPDGVGNGASINITTGSLYLKNGAVLNATTQGKGNAGNVNIFADDTISLDGVSANGTNVTTVLSGVHRGAEGQGGNINITTGSLYLKNGAVLNVTTQGKGNAGNVNIFARDTVSLDGVSANGTNVTTVVSGVQRGAEGQGGNIKITTGSLSVTNGGELVATNYGGKGDAGRVDIDAHDTVVFDKGLGNIATGAFSNVFPDGVGNGASINITTGSLYLKNGAVLNVTTQGKGNAGDVNIFAHDKVSLEGSGNNGSRSQLLSTVELTGVGKGGDINITTRMLSLRDRAKITVSSQGSGIAGSLIVEANSIDLDNQATISADTNGGQGNINLRSQDLLLLRRGSSITTNAMGNATGGNITIDTHNLVAVPKENSDISANAENSFGGRVIVNASGIFGIKFRLQPTPLSEITATSARGSEFNGVVQLNTPDVNPSQGLTALPTNIIDTSQLIANSCIAGSKRPEGKFIITGNGGLPVMPDDPSIAPYPTYQIPTVQSASISTSQENALDPENPTTSSKPYHSVKSAPLIEAQGWMYTANGEVILTASASTVPPHSFWPQLPTCSGS